MQDNNILDFIKNVLQNMPEGWLNITTHRLDIYNESLAKTEFLDEFEKLFSKNIHDQKALNELPTAYDYIRLGHPLSCILEWGIAKTNYLKAEYVISFQSNTVPVLAILRKNLLENKKTQILYTNEIPKSFDIEIVQKNLWL